MASRETVAVPQVRQVRPKSFAKELKKLMESSRPGAIYTEGPVSKEAYYDVNPNEYALSFTHSDVEKVTFTTYVQGERLAAADQLQNKWITLEEYNSRINFFNYMERLALSILEQFPGFYVRYANTHRMMKGKKGAGAPFWHQDNQGGDTQAVFVVMTVHGPSTEYMSENNGVIQLPENAMTGHTGNMFHQSPLQVMKNGRLALVLELRKIKKV